MKKLRVLVLTHEGLEPPESIEGLSDEDIFDWKMEFDVVTALRELGHEVRVLGLGNELRPIRDVHDEWKPHIAFNLLRHFQHVGLYDAHVISWLELIHLPYTGANPRGLLLASHKALAKKILTYHRIPVPEFAEFRRGHAIRLPRRLEFPLIVKTVAEHASRGIAQASIVHDEAAMQERVQFVHRKIGADALVERYIDGRELTISVLGNDRLQTFPVWEMRFEKLPDGTAPIATEKAKVDRKYQEKLGISTGPAEISEELGASIAKLAKRVFRRLDLSGFARIDLRMARDDDRIWVLEANPNPDLCYGEDFAESAERAGLSYPQLVQRILNLGLRHTPPWKEE